jgi:hypothetical protein
MPQEAMRKPLRGGNGFSGGRFEENVAEERFSCPGEPVLSQGMAFHATHMEAHGGEHHSLSASPPG